MTENGIVDLAAKSQAIVETTKQATAITDESSYIRAWSRLKMAKDFDRAVEGFFKPLKQAQDEAKKKLLAAERSIREPVQRAIFDEKGRIVMFDAECRRQAEAERAVKMAELRKQEEETRLAQAAVLEAEGKEEEALALLDQPAPITVSPEPEPVRPKGATIRTTWSAEVYDFQALVAFVAAHPDFTNLLLPNDPAINSLARAQQDALAIPGVRAVSKQSAY